MKKFNSISSAPAVRRSLGLGLGLLLSIGATTDSQSQSLSDGVRFGQSTTGVGSRSEAMGGAVVGAVNDLSAMFWNPAALAPTESREFTLSMFDRNVNSAALQNLQTNEASLNSTSFGSIGLAVPVETVRGHLAFAIAYDRSADYNSTYSFDNINTAGSFLNIRQFIQDPHLTTTPSSSVRGILSEDNLAWNLFLTYDLDSNNALTTPFGPGLRESGTVTTDGGMNTFRLAGAIDIAEGVSVGATLNLSSGSLDYRRVLTIEDPNPGGPTSALPPLGFQSAQIVDTRTQDQKGIGLTLGLLAYQDDPSMLGYRAGLTVETPTVISVNDAYQRTGTSQFFNDSKSVTADKATILVNDYTITTPFKLSGGLSVTKFNTTLAASASFVDHSQLRFSTLELQDLNDAARQNLRAVLSYSVGAEYVIAPIATSLRGGFAFLPSPYKSDPASAGTASISGGIGVLLGQSTLVEASYRHSKYATDHTIYSDKTPEGISVANVITQDDVKRDDFRLGVSFRF